MHIFVGSTNPVKLNAVTQAAIEQWSDVVVQGFEVESGVSVQPMSDEETKRGAGQRAKAALAAGLRIQRSGVSDTNFKGLNPNLCIGIGMEGGVFEQENGELWNTVWCCVIDQEGDTVFANGERFRLPESLAELIRGGQEMGPAMDELIGSVNIKHQQGMIGIITEGFITRTEMYAGLAKLALGLWYGRNWNEGLELRN